MHAESTCERERVDIFTVVCASHELLAETDGIFSLWDCIEDFEVLLRDALRRKDETRDEEKKKGERRTDASWEVHFHSKDADILWTRVELTLFDVERGHWGDWF